MDGKACHEITSVPHTDGQVMHYRNVVYLYTYSSYNRDLKREEAVKKTRQSIGKFPFKWNQDWLNFNALTAASS